MQIAKYFNCVVVATCGSAEKARVCKELGADYVVNYNDDPNWGTTIKEITVKAGKKWAGVDVFCGYRLKPRDKAKGSEFIDFNDFFVRASR